MAPPMSWTEGLKRRACVPTISAPHILAGFEEACPSCSPFPAGSGVRDDSPLEDDLSVGPRGGMARSLASDPGAAALPGPA